MDGGRTPKRAKSCGEISVSEIGFQAIERGNKTVDLLPGNYEHVDEIESKLGLLLASQ